MTSSSSSSSLLSLHLRRFLFQFNYFLGRGFLAILHFFFLLSLLLHFFRKNLLHLLSPPLSPNLSSLFSLHEIETPLLPSSSVTSVCGLIMSIIKKMMKPLHFFFKTFCLSSSSSSSSSSFSKIPLHVVFVFKGEEAQEVLDLSSKIIKIFRLCHKVGIRYITIIDKSTKITSHGLLQNNNHNNKYDRDEDHELYCFVEDCSIKEEEEKQKEEGCLLLFSDAKYLRSSSSSSSYFPSSSCPCLSASSSSIVVCKAYGSHSNSCSSRGNSRSGTKVANHKTAEGEEVIEFFPTSLPLSFNSSLSLKNLKEASVVDSSSSALLIRILSSADAHRNFLSVSESISFELLRGDVRPSDVTADFVYRRLRCGGSWPYASLLVVLRNSPWNLSSFLFNQILQKCFREMQRMWRSLSIGIITRMKSMTTRLLDKKPKATFAKTSRSYTRNSSNTNNSNSSSSNISSSNISSSNISSNSSSSSSNISSSNISSSNISSNSSSSSNISSSNISSSNISSNSSSSSSNSSSNSCSSNISSKISNSSNSSNISSSNISSSNISSSNISSSNISSSNISSSNISSSNSSSSNISSNTRSNSSNSNICSSNITRSNSNTGSSNNSSNISSSNISSNTRSNSSSSNISISSSSCCFADKFVSLRSIEKMNKFVCSKSLFPFSSFPSFSFFSSWVNFGLRRLSILGSLFLTIFFSLISPLVATTIRLFGKCLCFECRVIKWMNFFFWNENENERIKFVQSEIKDRNDFNEEKDEKKNEEEYFYDCRRQQFYNKYDYRRIMENNYRRRYSTTEEEEAVMEGMISCGSVGEAEKNKDSSSVSFSFKQRGSTSKKVQNNLNVERRKCCCCCRCCCNFRSDDYYDNPLENKKREGGVVFFQNYFMIISHHLRNLFGKLLSSSSSTSSVSSFSSSSSFSYSAERQKTSKRSSSFDAVGDDDFHQSTAVVDFPSFPRSTRNICNHNNNSITTPTPTYGITASVSSHSSFLMDDGRNASSIDSSPSSLLSLASTAVTPIPPLYSRTRSSSQHCRCDDDFYVSSTTKAKSQSITSAASGPTPSLLSVNSSAAESGEVCGEENNCDYHQNSYCWLREEMNSLKLCFWNFVHNLLFCAHRWMEWFGSTNSPHVVVGALGEELVNPWLLIEAEVYEEWGVDEKAIIKCLMAFAMTQQRNGK